MTKPMSKIIQFSTAVEIHARDTACSYIQACLEIADQQEIDEDRISKYISESLKQKIEIEAVRENTLRGNPAGSSSLTDFI